MNIEQLAEKIDIKFDSLEKRMDEERAARQAQALDFIERVVKVEEQYNNVSGQVKIVFALIGAVFTGIIGYISNIFSK